MVPTEIRDRCRVLRYRNLVVKQMVQMKDRVSGLLETGVSYNKRRLHKVGYFGELMSTNTDITDAVRPLLNLSRGMIRRSRSGCGGCAPFPESDRSRPWLGLWRSAITPASLPTNRPSATADCARRREKLCRQGDAHAAIETAQQTHPEGAGRGGQAGAKGIAGAGDDPYQRTGEKKSKPSKLRSGEEDGLLHVGGRAPAAGFRACRRTHPDRGSLKTFPDKGKDQDIGIYRSAGCQVSLVGD
jgi:hypothetical protein